MVYLIGVSITSIPMILLLGTTDGYFEVVSEATAETYIFGGIVLGLYYMVKSILKRTKATFKHNEPVS